MDWGEEEYPSSFLAATLPRLGGRGGNCWCLAVEKIQISRPEIGRSLPSNFNPHSTPIPDPDPNNISAGPTTTTPTTHFANDGHILTFIRHMPPPRQIVLFVSNRPLPVPRLSGLAATNGQVTCQKRCQVDSRCVLCCLAVAPHLSVRHHPRPSHGTCIPGNRRRLHVSAVVPTWPGLMSRTSVAMCDATGCSPCPRHLGT